MTWLRGVDLYLKIVDIRHAIDVHNNRVWMDVQLPLHGSRDAQYQVLIQLRKGIFA